jgi:iron complex transport system substrate-binding protein
MFRRALLALLLLLPVCGAIAFWIADESSRRAEGSRLAEPSSEFREVTDLAGRTVRLPSTINRFVLMRGMGLYDVAVLLGDEIQSKMVGWDNSLQTSDRDAYDKFLARFPKLKTTPLLGDSLRNGVSAEAVLALEPDVVIGGTYMIGQTHCLEQLERAGVPIVYFSSDDPFRDPQRSLTLLGQIFGKQERAAQIVNWVNQELNVVLNRMKELDGPVPSIYVEAGTYGPKRYGNTFGSDLEHKRVHWGSLLSQLRCQNVGAKISGPYGMAVIDPEYLLTADPDVIVVTGACWTAFPESLHLGYAADAEAARKCLTQFTERPGWPELSAVKKGRVYGLNTRLGAHIASFAAAQQLAQWLYPGEFKDLHPRERLQEFHDRFMPIEFSGTWMVALKAP